MAMNTVSINGDWHVYNIPDSKMDELLKWLDKNGEWIGATEEGENNLNKSETKREVLPEWLRNCLLHMSRIIDDNTRDIQEKFSIATAMSNLAERYLADNRFVYRCVQDIWSALAEVNIRQKQLRESLMELDKILQAK